MSTLCAVRVPSGRRAVTSAWVFVWGLVGGWAWAFNPAAGDFQKADPLDIRVLTYNTLGQFIVNPPSDPVFQRILTTIHPDIISFQEIAQSMTAQTIADRLHSYFPSETWTVHLGLSDGFNRNALASRFPLTRQITDTDPPANLRGVTAALVDLPNATYGSTDLYVMAVHLKSGGTLSDHQQRQKEADAIINWMRDARTAGCTTCPTGDHINLPAGTPMLVVGDVNLGYQEGGTFQDGGDWAPYHPTQTLMMGDIYDQATYGVSSPPDWDGTSSTDAAPYDHNTANSDTHRSDQVEPVSRLDRFLYTDSVMRVSNRFILNTLTMSAPALAAAGLLADDTMVQTNGASDHLPVVADFALGPDPAPPGKLIVNEFNYDNAGADTYSFLEFKNVGGQAVNLQAPIDYHLKISTNNLPTVVPVTPNESFNIDLQGIIPPGGIFVVYNSTGESVDVATSITAALPRLQRQDMKDYGGTFTLPNGPNTALALVTVEPWITASGTGTNTDTLVEAYLYEDTTLGTTNYFMTNGGNQLVIPLLGVQSSAYALSSTSQSYSRNVGDTAWNSFAQWTLPAPMTPGRENATFVNTPPTLSANTGLTVGRGEIGVITSSMLLVTDAENPPVELVYTVTVFPTHGSLVVGTTTLSSGGTATFTQADINAGLLKYVHGGAGSLPDSFTFTVSDGHGGTIGSTTFSITVIAPTTVGDWFLIF